MFVIKNAVIKKITILYIYNYIYIENFIYSQTIASYKVVAMTIRNQTEVMQTIISPQVTYEEWRRGIIIGLKVTHGSKHNQLSQNNTYVEI